MSVVPLCNILTSNPVRYLILKSLYADCKEEINYRVTTSAKDRTNYI